MQPHLTMAKVQVQVKAQVKVQVKVQVHVKIKVQVKVKVQVQVKLKAKVQVKAKTKAKAKTKGKRRVGRQSRVGREFGAKARRRKEGTKRGRIPKAPRKEMCHQRSKKASRLEASRMVPTTRALRNKWMMFSKRWMHPWRKPSSVGVS